MADGDDQPRSQIERFLKNRQSFYAVLGECITQWASIEGLIYEAFFICLKTKKELCDSIFWSIPSLTMRLSYTSNLVQICLINNKSLGVEWSKLNKRITELKKFRNYLAHQPPSEEIGREPTDDGGIIIHFNMPEEDLSIVPNILDRKQTFTAITAAHMHEHLEKLLELRFDLINFDAQFSIARGQSFPRKEST